MNRTNAGNRASIAALLQSLLFKTSQHSVVSETSSKQLRVSRSHSNSNRDSELYQRILEWWLAKTILFLVILLIEFVAVLPSLRSLLFVLILFSLLLFLFTRGLFERMDTQIIKHFASFRLHYYAMLSFQHLGSIILTKMLSLVSSARFWGADCRLLSGITMGLLLQKLQALIFSC